MNLNRGHIFCLVLILSFFSCTEENQSPYLIISNNNFDFLGEGGINLLVVKSNVSWNISKNDDWFHVEPTTGDVGSTNVRITVQSNNINEERTSSFEIYSESQNEQVLILQEKDIVLEIEKDTCIINADGGTISCKIESSENFSININEDWVSQVKSTSLNETEVSFLVLTNGTYLKRYCTISISIDNYEKKMIIYQNGDDITIPADQTGVESTAIELAAKIIAGWNVGNSLEVPGGETNWNNPKVTKDVIDAVKAAGFNAVRIPCAWDGYIIDRETFEIDPAWLIRVKEVIDYCIDNDMYAIINTHWDGGWLENNPTYDKQEEVNEQLYAIWQQVGIYFRSYDEHLLFAGTNEVHVDYNEPSSENIEVQESFNQTFVDAVRSTGGKNAYRNLIVQTYNTNIWHGLNYFEAPTDQVDDRLFVEVHYYDPYDFTLNISDGLKTLWGEGYDNTYWGQEDYVQSTFASMKTAFYDKGVPIILGEYGAMYRSNLTGNDLALHNESRNYFLKTVTAEAKANGFVPFIWDNGGDDFGLFNRYTAEQVNSDAIQAIIEGATN